MLRSASSILDEVLIIGKSSNNNLTTIFFFDEDNYLENTDQKNEASHQAAGWACLLIILNVNLFGYVSANALQKDKIEFFNLNLVSSSMVIKVDFDLSMSILLHKFYLLFAMEYACMLIFQGKAIR